MYLQLHCRIFSTSIIIEETHSHMSVAPSKGNESFFALVLSHVRVSLGQTITVSYSVDSWLFRVWRKLLWLTHSVVVWGMTSCAWFHDPSAPYARATCQIKVTCSNKCYVSILARITSVSERLHSNADHGQRPICRPFSVL